MKNPIKKKDSLPILLGKAAIILNELSERYENMGWNLTAERLKQEAQEYRRSSNVFADKARKIKSI